MQRASHSPRVRTDIEVYVVPDGTCFLYDTARDEGFALDQLGALVWDYCDGQTTQDDIVAEIVALLPDQPETAQRVMDLLATFAEQGLLAPDHAEATPSGGPAQPRENTP